jgi:hypothetical protein
MGESVRRCVESLAKLTDADRSGRLLLLAHNPKVGGSNPPPQPTFPLQVLGFTTSPDGRVGASCWDCLGLSTRSSPTCPAADRRYSTSSCVWLYRSPVLSELWPIHCFCRSRGVPALRSCVTRECLNACSPAFGIPSRSSSGWSARLRTLP